MKQVLIQQGEAVVREVPAPGVEPGRVLVRVARSCISIGTEMAGVRASGTPLWKKALDKPEQVKRVVAMAMDQGIAQTRQMVKNKLEAGQPTGYSASGVVIGVGEGIDDLRVGDRVACAGAQCAHHAEVISVPRNLTAAVPESLDDDAACTVTLGAIALQGVRRAEPTLGETFVVLGLGLIGQLTAQLLKAHGCTVLGSDPDAERCEQAMALGMSGTLDTAGDAIQQAHRLTDGHGADGVIITAAHASSGIVSTAFKMCRRKGRVVLVGDVGLDLNREDIYLKELDFRVSTSYGPGRYDASYEEDGHDYPVGYVRWTENRNMSAYLGQLASGSVQVAPLIAQAYPIDQAPRAYARLNAGDGSGVKPLAVLLSYERADGDDAAASTVVANPKAQPAGEGKVRLAVVGAGAFARGVHLPNLAKLGKAFHLQAVVSRSGHNASETARQFAASRSTTDYGEVLAADDVDAVLICTRHDQHAAMALAALEAGKHVLVEKPTALSRDELQSLLAFYDSPAGPKPILMTGYNRRFSPCMQRAAALTVGRDAPLVINYRMNAGHLPADHWTHGPEGGGRNLGEACHLYDLFVALTGARPVDVCAHTVRPRSAHDRADDNFVVTITFDDGSLATLTYTALGSGAFPKETCEIFCDGQVLSLNDYKTLTTTDRAQQGVQHRTIHKGHEEELAAFAHAIWEGGGWPITLQEQYDVMDIALKVQDQITGRG
ncbi:MAG: Gfo/Idh/MocA family oxidoreductase [Phycisphaerales bacterium JB063]